MTEQTAHTHLSPPPSSSGQAVRAAIHAAISPNGCARTIAVTMFDGRVSPRFDCAESLMVITAEGPHIVGIATVRCPGEEPSEKVRLLDRLGVDVLICGGLTQECRRQLEATHVALVPWARGEIGEVVHRFLRHHPALPSAPHERGRRAP